MPPTKKLPKVILDKEGGLNNTAKQIFTCKGASHARNNAYVISETLHDCKLRRAQMYCELKFYENNNGGITYKHSSIDFCLCDA